MLDFAVSREKLVEHALKHEKVAITVDGALVANTGSRTGRSVKDRYIVVAVSYTHLTLPTTTIV